MKRVTIEHEPGMSIEACRFLPDPAPKLNGIARSPR
jgi:hypothetical protein